MKNPSQTRLKEILRDSAFDPRSDGVNRIITETAVLNPQYAEDRAIEMIREAQLGLNSGEYDGQDYLVNMRRAIGLLALAVAVRLG